MTLEAVVLGDLGDAEHRELDVLARRASGAADDDVSAALVLAR